MSQETVEKTFNVPSPARLKISNLCGSVEVRPGEDGIIGVTAVKHTSSGDAGQTRIELSQETDGTVTLATRFPEGDWNWLFGLCPCEVDYLVKVPHLCSLKLNAVSSTMTAEGLQGDFSINSVSGELTLNRLTGPLKVNTVSGDVSGGRLCGPLDLNTVSGDVALNESDLPAVKAKTVSGDVALQTPLGEGPYQFNSVSGDVRLTVKPEARCTTEIHSLSGNFSTVFPVSRYAHTPGSHSVDVQGGGVKVTLNSISGDLRLDSDGEVQPAAASRKATTTEERREVLERIQRGEMSVEEALTKLRA